MIAGAIIIIAIAATGVLMMRFRKRWLAKINIAFTNRITGLFAGWSPGFGILTHVGRKSGKVYRTPVNVFRASNGFIIALTYSSQSEWVKNVLAAGGCELKTRGKKYQLSAPKVVRDPTRKRFPFPVRLALRTVSANEYMELSKSPATYDRHEGEWSNENHLEQERNRQWCAVGQNGKPDSAVRMPLLHPYTLQMRHFVLGRPLWNSFISADHQRTEPALVKSTCTS